MEHAQPANAFKFARNASYTLCFRQNLVAAGLTQLSSSHHHVTRDISDSPAFNICRRCSICRLLRSFNRFSHLQKCHSRSVYRPHRSVSPCIFRVQKRRWCIVYWRLRVSHRFVGLQKCHCRSVYRPLRFFNRFVRAQKCTGAHCAVRSVPSVVSCVRENAGVVEYTGRSIASIVSSVPENGTGVQYFRRKYKKYVWKK